VQGHAFLSFDDPANTYSLLTLKGPDCKDDEDGALSAWASLDSEETNGEEWTGEKVALCNRFLAQVVKPWFLANVQTFLSDPDIIEKFVKPCIEQSPKAFANDRNLMRLLFYNTGNLTLREQRVDRDKEGLIASIHESEVKV
jgi:hypothetical protein